MNDFNFLKIIIQNSLHHMDENGNVNDGDDERWSFKTFDDIIDTWKRGTKIHRLN